MSSLFLGKRQKFFLTLVRTAGIVSVFSALVFFAGAHTASAALDGAGSSLVGWWKFNESSGSSTDSSGGGHTGTLTGANYGNNLPQYVPGKLNNAINFDGGDDKVNVGDVNAAEATDTITVSAWVKGAANASTSDQILVSKTRGISGFTGWVMYKKATTGKFVFYVNTGTTGVGVTSNAGFADTNWHHVVGVYNGTNLNIYTDGVSTTTPVALTGAIADSARPICIGQGNGNDTICGGGGSSFWAGTIDDVRVYNRALSSTEVSQLYSNSINGIETVVAPTASTTAATSINANSVTGNGVITSTGGDPVTIRGFIYGLTTGYTAGTTTESGSFGTSTYSASISGLACNTLYHYKAYATNSIGTSYDVNDTTFTTATCSVTRPTVTTGSTSSLTSTSTSLSGTIVDTGNQNATVRGFVYGTTLAYGATTTESGSFSTGSFSSTTGVLTCNTQYNFKAYATNSGGTGYGTNQTFTTGTCSPSVTSFSLTSSVSGTTTVNITAFSGMDDTAVTGYLVRYAATNTPTANDSGWTGSAPTKFTFATAGPKVLYAWVKDGSGNISATSTATTSVSLSSYTPPVGIPDPSQYFGAFGNINRATPSLPTEWTQASPTSKPNYFFIDNSGSCTNSSNTYGYPGNPRCSAPEGVLAAGSFVYYNGGTYTTPVAPNTDRWDWCGAGTETSPIWITGNPYNMPVFSGYPIYLGYGCSSSYMVLENMKLISAGTDVTVQPANDGDNIDHIIIRNVMKAGTASNGDKSGIGIGASTAIDPYPNSTISYVVVYDDYIYNIGFIATIGAVCPVGTHAGETLDATSVNYCPAGDETGVYDAYHTDHVWVLDSTIYRMGADDVAGSHYSDNSTTMTTTNYFIGRNTLFQGGENCIDLKTVNHTVMSENTCYGPFSDENGWGIVLHYGGTSGVNGNTKDAWVLFNDIYNAGGGVGVTQGDNIHIIGNKVHGMVEALSTSTDPIDGACFGSRGFSGRMDIVGNTCYDYVRGVTTSNLPSGSSVNILGNVFSNRASSTQYELLTGFSSDSQYITMDDNLFYAPINAAKFFWNSASRNFAYMQGTAGQCAGCVEANPLFVSAGTGNFNLQSGSPAKDATTTEASVYSLFDSLYNLNIRRDFTEAWRPQGSGWDMGAFEFLVTDTTAPVISSIASSTGATTATVTWATDESATSTVEYGSNTSYGSSVSSDSFVVSHSLSITGLSTGTTYHFRVLSTDPSGNKRTSGDNTFSTILVAAPAVTTSAASSVGTTGATLNGSVDSINGSSITESGFAYATSSDLSTVIATSTLGSQPGAGSFSQNLTGLSCNTAYYFRTYATNSSGNGLGSILSFTTAPCVQTITADAASSITRTGGTINASITSTGGANATQSGFAYGTASDLSTTIATSSLGAQTGTVSFSQALTGLTCNTAYYYRPYTDNVSGSGGGRGFGTIATFTTSACVAPTVTVQAPSSVSNTAAIFNGTITDAGGLSDTAEGFQYGLTTSYGATTTVAGSSFTAGAFSKAVSGLTCNTPYHYKAFATNSVGTSYSSDQSFSTASCGNSAPTVSTDAASSIAATSATLNATIIATGGVDADESGFAYDVSPDFSTTIATSTLGNQTGTASFNQTISGLSCNTVYYYHAYAHNSAGTGYGSSGSFTTSACVPTVTVQNASSIGQNSATLNETLVDLGGAATTNRGFEYGLTTSYGSTITRPGSFTTGSYGSTASSLACGTTYHFRGYATNSAGVGSSSDQTFVTASCAAPTVLTLGASSVADTSATLNGSIAVTGGADATQSGFAYSADITLSSGVSTTTLGAQSGTASFSGQVSLSCATTYYVRAYAINSAGTDYGSIGSFTTSACVTQTTQSVSPSSSRPSSSVRGAALNSGAPQVASQPVALQSTTLASFIQALVKAGLIPEDRVQMALVAISAPSVSVPKTNLGSGNRGEQVKQLQTVLSQKGYLKAAPNGIFGPQTLKALKAFQKANGVPSTGFYGPLTRAALQSSR